jgi:hypothetical protein
MTGMISSGSAGKRYRGGGTPENSQSSHRKGQKIRHPGNRKAFLKSFCSSFVSIVSRVPKLATSLAVDNASFCVALRTIPVN